jgi:hypothetical protein
MRPLVPLLAILIAATPQAARAQVHPTHATGGNPAAAMQRAMQQEMRQQQQMIQQQQKAMQQQQKAMEQQQKTMLQQHQKATQQQQKAMEQQQKAMQAHANANATAAHATAGPSPVPEAQASPGTKTVHGATTHATRHTGGAVHASRYHWLRTWPSSSSASYHHLMALKQSLDTIARTATPSTSQKMALRNNLSRVIVNSPHPTTPHMQTLSDHLSTALAGRGTPPVDTKSLALQLRAMMNVVHLPAAQSNEALVEHRSTLTNAGVPAAQVETISGDLQGLAVEMASKLP